MIRPEQPKIAFYFYVLRDCDFVSEFCVANHNDPDQYIETIATDGVTRQKWDRREEGDLLVFRPPDGYEGSQGLVWVYDRRLQIGVMPSREDLEKLALRMRTSVIR